VNGFSGLVARVQAGGHTVVPHKADDAAIRPGGRRWTRFSNVTESRKERRWPLGNQDHSLTSPRAYLNRSVATDFDLVVVRRAYGVDRYLDF
jgi:hypothetical protein